MAAAYAGLDLLATAVVALDAGYTVRYANPAAEEAVMYLVMTYADTIG